MYLKISTIYDFRIFALSLLYLIGDILFVCLGFFVPLQKFSLIWRRQHCRWWAAHFDRCLALLAIEQWEFFSVQHLLWNGAFPRTRYTHTYCGAFSSAAVTSCLYDLSLSRLGLKHPTFRLRGEPSSPLGHRRRLLERRVAPHPRILCAKFSLNWPKCYWEENFETLSIYFLFFIITFPQKRMWSFTGTHLKTLQLRKLAQVSYW